MDVQRHSILPRRRHDRRHAFARQNHAENRGADFDVLEVNAARNGYITLKRETLGVSGELQREVALHGDTFEISDGHIGALQRDSRSLWSDSGQRNCSAGGDRSTSDICAQTLDVHAIASKDQRAGDVIDQLRKTGKSNLRVAELCGSGNVRRRHRATQSCGDDDVSVGANIFHEELQQRGLECSPQIEVQPLRAGDFGKAGDGERRISSDQRELKVIEHDLSVAQRNA